MAMASTKSGPSTRERLIRAGLDLFQKRGYTAAGLTEILARAGAPKGSLYHHFPGGKEALAVACLTWLTDEITAYLDGLSAHGADFETRVRGLARHVADGLADPEAARGSLYTILAQEAVPASPAIADALARSLDALVARLADAAQPPARARLALALIDGAATQARIMGTPDHVLHTVDTWLESGASLSQKVT